MKAKDAYLQATKEALEEAQQNSMDQHGLCEAELLDRFMTWMCEPQSGGWSPLINAANEFIEELNEQAIEEGSDA